MKRKLAAGLVLLVLAGGGLFLFTDLGRHSSGDESSRLPDFTPLSMDTAWRLDTGPNASEVRYEFTVRNNSSVPLRLTDFGESVDDLTLLSSGTRPLNLGGAQSSKLFVTYKVGHCPATLPKTASLMPFFFEVDGLQYRQTLEPPGVVGTTTPWQVVLADAICNPEGG